MRINNIKIKLTIPIPYDKPDGNGRIYTKDVVERGVNKLSTHIPIYCGDTIIGTTTGNSHITTWDDENQVCNLTIDGIIFHGGTRCIADTTDNKVSFMKITGFGISL